jgi:hypothetical protein
LELDSFQDVDKICAFLNIFHLLLIHSFLLNGGSYKNSLEKTKFYSTYKYNIGGFLFSLNDIEHGILKSNSPIPGNKQKEYFSKNDKRSDFTVKYKDIRIFFAMEYTSKNISKIKVYNPNNYTNALSLFTACFIDQEVSISKGIVNLSSLFKWYSSEFEDKKRKILHFIRKFCTENELKEAVETLISKDQKIQFKHSSYHWSMTLY